MVSRERKEQSWKTKAFEEGNAFQLQKYSLGEEQVLASPPALLGAGARPETPVWTRTLCCPGGGGCGRMGVRGAWGWKSVACFGLVFPLDSSLSVGLDSAPARRGAGDGLGAPRGGEFGGLQPWVGGEGPLNRSANAPHPPLLGLLPRSCDSDSATQAPAKTCFFWGILAHPFC